MADMLVKLYTLPPLQPSLDALKSQDVEIRRALAAEKHVVAEWVRSYFSEVWAEGCRAACEQRPVACFLAVEREVDSASGSGPYDLPAERLLGFAGYDIDARGMFGPLGVREDRREQGIGKVLLLATLYAMRAEGYAYAIIGWAGPVDFYTKIVGATVIEGSEPGIFIQRLILPD